MILCYEFIHENFAILNKIKKILKNKEKLRKNKIKNF